MARTATQIERDRQKASDAASAIVPRLQRAEDDYKRAVDAAANFQQWGSARKGTKASQRAYEKVIANREKATRELDRYKAKYRALIDAETRFINERAQMAAKPAAKPRARRRVEATKGPMATQLTLRAARPKKAKTTGAKKAKRQTVAKKAAARKKAPRTPKVPTKCSVAPKGGRLISRVITERYVVTTRKGR